MENKKILVAFFSRTGENYFPEGMRVIEKGNTHIAAQMIAESCGADLFQIQPAQPYADTYKDCVIRAKQEFDTNARPALAEGMDVSGYDVIFVGYPNWCGTMPMAVWTFLENHDFAGKILCPFCTHEGSGLANSVADMKKLAPNANVQEGLAVKGSCVQDAKEAISEWAANCL